MERNVGFEEISDGKRYGLNDMVKVDCNGCAGCHACCEHMEQTILIDPLDAFHMECGLQTGFEGILTAGVDLKVFEGVILPVLKMTGKEERCSFLNKEGRCSIHAYRPSICRLFPLGRIYENGSFSYFLQTGECPYGNKTKIKVKKWIDCADTERNQKFINDWHYFVKGIQEQSKGSDMTWIKSINQELLQVFYLLPYDFNQDFYEQFNGRYEMFRKKWNLS